jgi:phage-related protein
VPRAIIFYRTEKGRCPVADFLDSMPPKVAQKMAWVLKLVQELDIIPGQYFRKLTAADELWECRVVFGGNTYRILAFYHGKNQMVLTHGFMKKTPKTPLQEIEEAKRLRADYLWRQGDA